MQTAMNSTHRLQQLLQQRLGIQKGDWTLKLSAGALYLSVFSIANMTYASQNSQTRIALRLSGFPIPNYRSPNPSNLNPRARTNLVTPWRFIATLLLRCTSPDEDNLTDTIPWLRNGRGTGRWKGWDFSIHWEVTCEKLDHENICKYFSSNFVISCEY